jgi:cAMP phosphodiesterase
LTQSQIISFCKKHKKNLASNNAATLFLFKENNEFFVAYVCVDFDGLLVDVYRFEDDRVWSAAYAHRLVVPATKLVA